MRTKREPRPLGRIPKTSWPECKVEKCERTTKGGAHGFCWTHYAAVRRGQYDKETGAPLRAPRRVASYGAGARCCVPTCGRRPFSNGVCSLHYSRWRDGQDIGVTPPTYDRERAVTEYHATAVCLMPACGKRPVNNWMCNKHAQQREAGIISAQGEQLRPLIKHGPVHKDGPVLDPAGYLRVRAPEGYRGKTVNGRVLEHRLVMEQHLGRLLHGRDSPYYEIVHHKDGNKLNNDISNLEIHAHKEHPPGHVVPPEQLSVQLDALRVNNPEAYAALLEKLKQ